MSNEDVKKVPFVLESPTKSIVTPDWFISNSLYEILEPIHNSEVLLVLLKRVGDTFSAVVSIEN